MQKSSRAINRVNVELWASISETTSLSTTLVEVTNDHITDPADGDCDLQNDGFYLNINTADSSYIL
jgi:hypothetical protein